MVETPTDPDTLLASVEALEADIATALRALVEARVRAARERTPEVRAEAERLREAVDQLLQRQSALVDLIEASVELNGGPSMQDLRPARTDNDPFDRRPRSSLKRQLVDQTADLDDCLPDALDAVLSLLPKGWLDAEPAEQFHLSARQDSGAISIVKGMRPEGEFPTGHRFRQALHACNDYLKVDPGYDHFAGATLVPQITQLGRKLEALGEVGGSAERIASLWKDDKPDSTLFELFVAAGCIDRGTPVSFIPRTHEKTADLRSYRPYPLLIECKRRQALNPYELAEEAIMRDIFERVFARAAPHGLYGRFSLTATVSADKLDPQEIADKLFAQRLAAHADRPLQYPWGEVAFQELPRRTTLPSQTKAYSPILLKRMFDWESDVPEWDGIVCRFDGPQAGFTDEARSPIGLVWKNLSEAALRKRAWAPVDLFQDATKQITPGEVGIIYVAYNEGARADIADDRYKRYEAWLQDMEHRGDIRLPINFLVRLFPRALDHGNPDLIESVVKFYNATYGDETLFDDFPAGVFATAS